MSSTASLFALKVAPSGSAVHPARVTILRTYVVKSENLPSHIIK